MILLGSILVIICGVLITMFIPKKINPSSISISEIVKNETGFSVRGTLLDSALVYSGYNASKENGKLFIEIKGKLTTFSNKSGDFTINLEKEKYGIPEEIYLRNGSQNAKIWPK
ncbi:hypothetical protein D3C75_1213820 [compost metagenome]